MTSWTRFWNSLNWPDVNISDLPDAVRDAVPYNAPRRAVSRIAPRRGELWSRGMDGAQISTLPQAPQAVEQAPVPVLAPVPPGEAPGPQALHYSRLSINRDVS